MNAFQEILTASLNEKKGILLFIPGQSIAGVVTSIRQDGVVELRSREYSRILVRLDQVAAVTMS